MNTYLFKSVHFPTPNFIMAIFNRSTSSFDHPGDSAKFHRLLDDPILLQVVIFGPKVDILYDLSLF